MTYLFKLARRTACHRALPLVALAAAIAACSTDQLAPNSQDPEVLTLSEPAPVATATETPSFSAAFRGGIPFGFFALPNSALGETYNGITRNIAPEVLLENLAEIKARGGRIVLSFAGPERYFKDSQGNFSFTMWKERLNRLKGVDFTSYINDGTVIGHFLIDEPNDPRNWNGTPVSGPMLEQMAAYSKQLWPNMATIIRTKPTYMGQWGAIYHNVDAAWAQWWTTQGDPGAYIQRESAEAQRLGLKLIAGMNTTAGGPDRTHMSASTVQSAGLVLLSNDYICAFINWKYEDDYLSRSDIKSAMSKLSEKAEAHSPRSCSRGTGGPVTLPGIKGIVLTGTKVIRNGTQVVELRWTGAAGSYVDIYRNGDYRRTTPNDNFAREYARRAGKYTYKICEAGKSRCSNSVSVTIK